MQTFIIRYLNEHDREIEHFKYKFPEEHDAWTFGVHFCPEGTCGITVEVYRPEERPLMAAFTEPILAMVQFQNLPEFLQKKDNCYQNTDGKWTILRDYRPRKRQSIFFGGAWL